MNRHVLLCALGVAMAVHAKPMMSKFVPIDRLIENTRAAIKTTPKDAENHYVLGRLLTMKYCGQTDFQIYGGDEKSVPRIHSFIPERPAEGKLHDDKLLDEALTELGTAEKLDGTLTKAMLAEGWVHTERAKGKAAESETAAAREAYRKVVAATRKAGNDGLTDSVGREAAEQLLKLGVPDGEDKELQKFLHPEKGPDKSGHGVVMSPVVVLLDGSNELAPAIDARAHVHFDLDGLEDGLAWPWPKPATGILVWDPERAGKIEGGRQLFGNITWFVPFSDGYRALAALDDDHDGQLRGRELDGVRVWLDADHDGRSAPGEVHDLGAFGIVAINATAEGRREGVPWSSRGVTLRDGSTRVTFDWTPTSSPEPAAAR